MSVSKLAGSIKASMTLAITAKTKRLKSEGKSIIAFTAGEPDFDTPSIIKDSAKVALDSGFTKYTDSSGTLEFRKAICDKFLNDNNLEYKPSQIVVSSGAKSTLYHAMLAILNPGDEVIIPSPFWLTYEEQVKLVGGVCVFVDTSKTGFKLTKKQLEDNLTKNTKCILINSPSNPTGVVYTKEDLQVVADFAVKNDLYVISDEIYEKLVYGAEHISIASLNDAIKQKTIVVNGVSKTYSMTGWRVGYSASNEEIARAMGDIQSHTTSNACSISQYASVTALKDAERFVDEARVLFEKRLLHITNEADKLKDISYAKPQGAFYLFMNVSKYYNKMYNGNPIKGSIDFTNGLLDFGVAVIPGIPFGDDECVRLSYAISEKDITTGFERIGEFLASLK